MLWSSLFTKTLHKSQYPINKTQFVVEFLSNNFIKHQQLSVAVGSCKEKLSIRNRWNTRCCAEILKKMFFPSKQRCQQIYSPRYVVQSPQYVFSPDRARFLENVSVWIFRSTVFRRKSLVPLGVRRWTEMEKSPLRKIDLPPRCTCQSEDWPTYAFHVIWGLISDPRRPEWTLSQGSWLGGAGILRWRSMPAQFCKHHLMFWMAHELGGFWSHSNCLSYCAGGPVWCGV